MSRTVFDCVLCLEQKSEAHPRSVGSSRICNQCARETMKPLFEDALEHEYQYPPMWGKEELEFEMFTDLFDVEFEDAWRGKVREYTVPIKNRLYCEHRDCESGNVCGAYLGSKGLGLVLCSECQSHTCRACGMSDGNDEDEQHHACRKVANANAFEELQKGEHYQICPGCEQEVFQAEGCNHMTCRPLCGTHFCFICGHRVAARRSGHWQRGGCPRFGVAGPRRIWDDLDEHSEDEAEEASGQGDGNANFFALPRDVAKIIETTNIFDHAADAERVESNRIRITRGVESSNSEIRVRFFGWVSTNLSIVLQVMRTRFDPDQAPNLLTEFTQRHRQIREHYSNQLTLLPQPGTVTQLSDLSAEFDAYFVFALETIAELNDITRPRPMERVFG